MKLLDRLPMTGGARVAVTEFLEQAPKGTEVGWIRLMLACLDGLDMPNGRPCTADQLATVCRDFSTNQAGDWNARFFRVCLGSEMRATPPAAGSVDEILAQRERDRRGVA